MATIRIKGGFLTLGETDFNCPYCGKKHDDTDNKYLDRVNKNLSNTTKVKCECKEVFLLTYDMTGKAKSFKKDNNHG